MKLLKKVYLIFLVTVLLFFFVLFFFFGTDRGVHLMLRTITDWISNFEIGSIHGNWFHGVTLKDVCYHKDGINIRSTELYISIDLSYLWNKCFYINSLFFKDCFIRMEFSKLYPVLLEIKQNKNIARFIDLRTIIFRNIILNNISIELDEMIITLDKCSTGFKLQKKYMTMFPTFFSGLKLSNSLNFLKINTPFVKELFLKNFVPSKESISQFFKYIFSSSFFKKKNIDFFSVHYLIFEGIEGKNLFFYDQGNILIKQFRMQGIFSKEYIRLILLEVMSSYGVINIMGNINFDKTCLISLFADFRSSSMMFVEKERINCIISGYLNDTLHICFQFSGMLNARLSIKLQLFKVGVPLNLVFNVGDMHIPLVKGADYFIEGLNFNLNGNLLNYYIDLKLILSSSGLSFPIHLVMHSSGDTNNLVISNRQLKDKSGILSINGAINWEDIIAWQLKLNFKNINFDQCKYIWPISLSGEIDLHGNFLDGRLLDLKFLNIALSGVMQYSRCINFNASFIKNVSNEWKIPQFILSIGSNSLEVFGDFKKFSFITAIIKVSSLNEVFPYLNGSVFGNINFYRSFKNSKFLMDIFVKSFSLIDRNLKIDQIIVQGNLQYENNLWGNFEFKLSHLIYDSIFFPKISWQIIGGIKNHYIKFLMSTDLFEIVTKIRGSIDYIHKNWNGNILNIDFLKNQTENSHLGQRMMKLYYNLPDQLIFLIDHLDKHAIFRLSCDPFFKKEGIQKFIHPFQDLHLVFQQSLISRSIHLRGKFNLFLDLIWNKNSFFPQGKIFVSGNQIEWASVLFKNKPFILFKNITLNFFLKEKYIYSYWFFKTKDHGQCYGRLKILLFDKYKFLGDLCTKELSLSFFNIFLIPIDIVDGIVNLHLKFSGNFFHPEVEGLVKLENIILRSDQLPFIMTSSNLLLNVTGNRSTLDGIVDTNHGKLYVSGNIYWNNIRFIYSHIRVVGHDVRFVLSSTVKMDISPVIIFEYTPHELLIRGTLDIPWADIGLKEYLRNIVNISSDEVVMTDNVDDLSYYWKDKNSIFTNISTNIVVRFGNNVRVTFLGLDAKLHGNLRLVQNQYGFGLQGYVDIPQGQFKAYGQSLFIKKGQLLFSGLMDNKPYLNIEVVHSPELLQSIFSSGIRITGHITSPQVEILSDRSIFQKEMISSLLGAQKLNFFDIKGNNTLRSILIRLGLIHTDKFIKGCERMLKVKDLILSTDGLGDESQIILSGYIAPGLQIKYGLGIFDSLATVTVRYRFLPNLYLEVISGKTQIADLVYQFKY